jgi:hypothetical protein
MIVMARCQLAGSNNSAMFVPGEIFPDRLQIKRCPHVTDCPAGAAFSNRHIKYTLFIEEIDIKFICFYRFIPRDGTR